MSIFNKTVNATIGNLPATFKSVVESFASDKSGNVSCTVSGTSCSLVIDEDTCSFTFPSAGSYTGTYQWSITICDAPDYEFCSILNRESFSGIDGANTSEGDQRYNLVIFKYNKKLVCMNSVGASGYCLSDLFNIPKGRYNITSLNDVYITKALINPDLTTANSIYLTDNLYVSTNLINVGVKTIVKSKSDDTKQFINVGGIFYLPYSASILTISSKDDTAAAADE